MLKRLLLCLCLFLIACSTEVEPEAGEALDEGIAGAVDPAEMSDSTPVPPTPVPDMTGMTFFNSHLMNVSVAYPAEWVLNFESGMSGVGLLYIESREGLRDKSSLSPGDYLIGLTSDIYSTFGMAPDENKDVVDLLTLVIEKLDVPDESIIMPATLIETANGFETAISEFADREDSLFSFFSVMLIEDNPVLILGGGNIETVEEFRPIYFDFINSIQTLPPLDTYTPDVTSATILSDAQTFTDDSQPFQLDFPASWGNGVWENTPIFATSDSIDGKEMDEQDAVIQTYFYPVQELTTSQLFMLALQQQFQTLELPTGLFQMPADMDAVTADLTGDFQPDYATGIRLNEEIFVLLVGITGAEDETASRALFDAVALSLRENPTFDEEQVGSFSPDVPPLESHPLDPKNMRSSEWTMYGIPLVYPSMATVTEASAEAFTIDIGDNVFEYPMPGISSEIGLYHIDGSLTEAQMTQINERHRIPLERLQAVETFIENEPSFGYSDGFLIEEENPLHILTPFTYDDEKFLLVGTISLEDSEMFRTFYFELWETIQTGTLNP